MNALAKALLVGATALTVTAGAASASAVCNGEGECWHTPGKGSFPPELKLQVHPDNWTWSRGENFHWREHPGRGFWRHGTWVRIW